MMRRVLHFCRGILLPAVALIGGCSRVQAPLTEYEPVADSLLHTGLRTGESFRFLHDLTAETPHRLSGSEGAAKAVRLMKEVMEREGFDRVHLEECMVPHWVRGTVERAELLVTGGKKVPLNVCALGGSIATPPSGISGEVIEVTSLDQASSLGQEAVGKIVFYDRPFDPAKLSTFDAYGGAVDQRAGGAIAAARVGAIGVIVRSMSTAVDDVPHTGSMSYQDSVPKIPAAAVSTVGANLLHDLLKANPRSRLHLTLSCSTLPDVPSANVVGEITGSEHPDQVIVIGGHLDCWDKGAGAHDDGAGCVQAIEALRLIRALHLRPKCTIRAVLFMNEENGLRGGRAYVADHARKSERQLAGIESDRGGFAPRGFDVDADSVVLGSVSRWKDLFKRLDAGEIRHGGSGVDVSPMVTEGVPGFGLNVESQRYFDYHHSDNDTIDKVNPRELELGAIVEALLAYLISENGPLN